MRFMVMVNKSGAIDAAVTRTKQQAFGWLAEWQDDTTVAWRYHDGDGWACGSDNAHEHIVSLPRAVDVQIYR